MTSNQTPARLFLASDQIWPSAINRRFPDARFIARCRLDSTGVHVSPVFSSVAPTEIWGVLIETQLLPEDSREIAVVDDFGNELVASIDPGEVLSGDPQSLFMASRYWELDPSYIQQLRQVLQSTGLETADEEPRDDGALNEPAAPAP